MAELVYLYGLIPANETQKQSVHDLKGIDGHHDVYTIPINNITAVVCNLNKNEYSEDAIKEKINNDTEWLKEKAFHHHEMLMALHKQFTAIPMKFCTIYENKENLTEVIEKNREKLTNSFARLDGNEEWNLKIYCDDEKLKQHVSQDNSNIDAKKQEISQLSPGRQYFEKKKIDQLLDTELEKEKNTVCESLHQELTGFSLNDTIKRNWSSDVTGTSDTMSWNSVYLIPVPLVEDFLERVEQSKDKLLDQGWRFEASGPWPAYHFASLI